MKVLNSFFCGCFGSPALFYCYFLIFSFLSGAVLNKKVSYLLFMRVTIGWLAAALPPVLFLRYGASSGIENLKLC